MKNATLSDFFSKIIYSSSNEDTRSEIEALQIQKDDHALVITGSGSRPLELLVNPIGSLHSVDYNGTQNYLLELKVVALKNLENNEFLKFLGARDCVITTREKMYQSLRDYLSPSAKLFWDGKINEVKDGILNCGVWHKYLKKSSSIYFLRRSLLNKLWNARDITLQADIWDKE